MTKKISISDVARTAGVSTATVSRVLNNVSTVDERNRRRVQEAIRRLRYRPNPNAQRLAAGRNTAIGIVLPRFADMFHSFYVSELTKGAGAAAERAHYDL